MIRKRENDQDKQNQKVLFDRFSRHLEMTYGQFSSFSKKYRIDGFVKDVEDNVTGWVECKWYKKKAYCWLNLPKYNELITLAEITGQPSYLVFRIPGKLGYIKLHDGETKTCSYTVKVTGGTQWGRFKNEDDIEPLICLGQKQIVWFADVKDEN